ncbi:MAG: DUF2281 domain-containing protein [Coleofasciculus sp. C3-bin4]|nr:DUF2281 domain-containing protein [Coleofasciculus sp. C3-bin4]
MSLEEAILEKVRTLPLDRQQQVLDFVEFLQSKSWEIQVNSKLLLNPKQTHVKHLHLTKL